MHDSMHKREVLTLGNPGGNSLPCSMRHCLNYGTMHAGGCQRLVCHTAPECPCVIEERDLYSEVVHQAEGLLSVRPEDVMILHHVTQNVRWSRP